MADSTTSDPLSNTDAVLKALMTPQLAAQPPQIMPGLMFGQNLGEWSQPPSLQSPQDAYINSVSQWYRQNPNAR
jgi:hypothetical protein